MFMMIVERGIIKLIALLIQYLINRVILLATVINNNYTTLNNRNKTTVINNNYTTLNNRNKTTVINNDSTA